MVFTVRSDLTPRVARWVPPPSHAATQAAAPAAPSAPSVLQSGLGIGYGWLLTWFILIVLIFMELAMRFSGPTFQP